MVESVKYAFVSGELSPKLLGRTDLEKYEFGLAKAENWFVDFRGGLSNRPGTQFIDYVMRDSEDTKFVPFRFAPNLANTYIILFGDNYIRFIQNSGYVLEDAKTVTDITQGVAPVVTSAAHGFANGDWVYIAAVAGMTEINGRLFQISSITTDTFVLRTPLDTEFSTTAFTAYTSGGTVARVYTLSSPYDGNELAELQAKQTRDYVRLTHVNHPPRSLVRTDHTDWDLVDEEFGNLMDRPTNLVGTGNDTGPASVAFAVTAVDEEGNESLASDILIVEGIVNYTTEAGSVTLTWDAVDGARYYNVYRSNVFSVATAGFAVTRAAQLGFLGQSFGPLFTDTNIIPDFTKSPPQGNQPFANSPIADIEVTAGGTLYAKDDAVVVTDPDGTGFSGYPVVTDGGVIVAVVVQNGGSGYTAPVVSFTTSTGSGATATATVGPSEGNYPRVSAIFQQRQLYAATENDPLTIWGSKPGKFQNFDTSEILNDGDGYEHRVESEEVAPIEHLMPTRQGLLIFSRSGIWRMHGGSEEIVTPLNASIVLQSSRGSSGVPPMAIDHDILFVEGKSPTVRLIAYSELSKVYDGQDLSILSNHLFSTNKYIVSWGYAQNPHYVVWAVRSDGALLSFTLLKEQEVFAWTPCSTKGRYKDVVVIQENNLDRVYLMVERRVNGRWTKFIERMADREFEWAEDGWFVDCGLELPFTTPNAYLIVEAAEGDNVEVVASAAVWAVGIVGGVIRGGGGKMTILERRTDTHLQVRIDRPLTNLMAQDPLNTPLPIEAGYWRLSLPATEVSGLEHLEGQTVQILADGNLHSSQVVTGGKVPLQRAATKVIVGIGYSSVAQTLPPTIPGGENIDARIKDPLKASLRLRDSRGLKVGAKLDKLYEMKERTTEPYGAPTEMMQGYKEVPMGADWDVNGQFYIVQEFPLPATVLGYTLDLDVGDDPG
jgi:hypothetical protein